MAAIVLGIVFVLVGLLGFFNNPVLGLFAVDTTHNLIHIISGLVLLAGAYTSLGSAMGLRIIGVVYAIVAVVGFFSGDMFLGLFVNNLADRWLHVVLAIVILAAGFGLADDDARAMPA
jgi:hypothetical protein